MNERVKFYDPELDGLSIRRFAGWQAKWLRTASALANVPGIVVHEVGLVDARVANLSLLMSGDKLAAFLKGDEDEFYRNPD